jgi:uncharacterized protein YbjT (DUF2867 family)
MTIFVANANGKVGQEVAKGLIALGRKVRVGAHTPAKTEGALKGAEIVAFDYADPASIAAALQGARAVFTAAPFPLLPKAEIDLVAVAKAAGVARIVKLSAMGAQNFPGAPHTVAEEAIAASGLEWTFLRPNTFMQNYATLSAEGIRRTGVIYEPAADAATSFVDTRDIAAVAIKALTEPGHAGKAYTLTGPQALDRNAVARALSEATGKTIAYVPIDDAALRKAMAGAPPVMIELMSALFARIRSGQTAVVAPDIRQALGRAAISFAQFAKDYRTAWA